MRKSLIAILALIAIFIFAIPVSATSNPSDVWVFDGANVLNETTEDYINKMNQTFESENRNARFAVVIASKLQDNHKSYMSSLFNEYEMSYDDNSYDVLVYIAIEDHKYDIECGGAYELEENEFLNQDLTVLMFGEEVKACLYEEAYDDAIMAISKHFETMMNRVDSGYYISALARKEKTTMIFAIVIVSFIIGVVAFYSIKLFVNYKHEKKETKTKDNISANQNDLKE